MSQGGRIPGGTGWTIAGRARVREVSMAERLSPRWSTSRPVVTTTSGMTLDGRVLDWGQPIDRTALASVRGPGWLCERLDPGVVLTGADTLWPFPGNAVWPAGIDRPPATAPV